MPAVIFTGFQCFSVVSFGGMRLYISPLTRSPGKPSHSAEPRGWAYRLTPTYFRRVCEDHKAPGKDRDQEERNICIKKRPSRGTFNPSYKSRGVYPVETDTASGISPTARSFSTRAWSALGQQERLMLVSLPEDGRDAWQIRAPAQVGHEGAGGLRVGTAHHKAWRQRQRLTNMYGFVWHQIFDSQVQSTAGESLRKSVRDSSSEKLRSTKQPRARSRENLRTTRF
jgi:hypothetical protein